MSKRKRRKFELGQSSAAQSRPLNDAPVETSGGHAAEYRIIRRDLLKVVVVNGIFLAAVLILYFTNLQSNYLEQLYSKLF